VDLSDEHSIVDLKNRVEASVVIWQKKMTHKDSKLSWGHNARHEKRGMFEGRAENVLLLIKHRFPGIAQSALDISKIQCNKVGGSEEEAFRVPLLSFFPDTRHIASLTCLLECPVHAYLPSTMHLLLFRQDVGLAILESYSRALESLAFTVMSRIEDVLGADLATRDDPKNAAGLMRIASLPCSDDTDKVVSDAKAEVERMRRMEPVPPAPMLYDFVGPRDQDLGPRVTKISSVATKRFSYLENLGGTRSPIARH
jgi:hypothetical protein